MIIKKTCHMTLKRNRVNDVSYTITSNKLNTSNPKYIIQPKYIYNLFHVRTRFSKKLRRPAINK